jgi:hypothetical protein
MIIFLTYSTEQSKNKNHRASPAIDPLRV